jgi:hypothetical protein
MAQRLEVPGGEVGEDTPADQAAVALLEGVEHRPTTGAPANGFAIE